MTDTSLTNGDLAQRHLRFGWWSLLLFIVLGLLLETLHGFKVRAYLDVSNQTRRLMWTLAHAHGSMLALVHIAFALCLITVPELRGPRLSLASRCLLAASVLLPGGFFLGGVSFYAGDPGLGVLLVPAGAVALVTAVFCTARELSNVTPARGPRPRANR